MDFQWPPGARALWAKTGENDGEWLSLAQHLEDSARVSAWLWDHWLADRIKQQLSEDLSLSLEETKQFITFLAGTHDLGKAGSCFTYQLPPHRYSSFGERAQAAGLEQINTHVPIKYPHSAGSSLIIEEYLQQLNNYAQPAPQATKTGETNTAKTRKPKRSERLRAARVRRSVAGISGSHHGLPATPEAYANVTEEQNRQSPNWTTTQQTTVQAAANGTNALPALKKVLENNKPLSKSASMVLTGIVIMTDWIASNQKLFPCVKEMPIDAFKRSLEQNHTNADTKKNETRFNTGVNHLQLPSPWRPQQITTRADEAYKHRFNWPNTATPYTVQTAAYEEAKHANGPIMMCIEAAMGEGKTEAALMAAEVLAHKNGCNGIAFAAPTQATANGLFHRIKKWAQAGATAEDPVSMYLAHGKNILNDEYTSLARSIHEIYDGDHSGSSGVIAHSWLRGRKKGILASISVMTIDQVLMLALQSKHAMLRHLGFAGKVVVIDEAHAYDAYMNVYLHRALEWLAAYGVPVIVLSATLPSETRASLLEAYSGREHAPQESEETKTQPSAYPLITVTGKDSETRSRGVQPSGRKQSVALHAIDDSWQALQDALADTIESGGCTLVICNTVARAQYAYAQLKNLVGADAFLIHSRFTSADRVEAETQLTSEIGADAKGRSGEHACENGKRPWRRIVVSTQIVEQSMDVDFDCIITDLAPIDLLIQRIGRLHRHQRHASERPAWAQQPQVIIRGVTDPGATSSQPVFAKYFDLVYDQATLMATWDKIQPFLHGQPLEIPAMIPQLVESVYSHASEVQPKWQAAYETAVHERNQERVEAQAKADTFLFAAPTNHNHDFVELWDRQRSDAAQEVGGEERGLAQVRDTDPSIEVLLTVDRGSGYYSPLPWVGPGYTDTKLAEGSPISQNTAFDIATSSVRLPLSMTKYPQAFDKTVTELEETTDKAWAASPLLRGQLQLNLDERGQATLNGHNLIYQKELGLVDITKMSEDECTTLGITWQQANDEDETENQ